MFIMLFHLFCFYDGQFMINRSMLVLHFGLKNFNLTHQLI